MGGIGSGRRHGSRNKTGSIQEQIREYLLTKGMTQRQFAYEIGITQSTLEAWLATPGTKSFREPNKLQENACRWIMRSAYNPEIWAVPKRRSKDETRTS